MMNALSHLPNSGNYLVLLRGRLRLRIADIVRQQVLNVPLEGRNIAIESKRPSSEKNTYHQRPQLEPVGQT